MPLSLGGLKSKAIAVAIFILAALFAPPALYDLYQEHTKKADIESQFDSSMRKAESLSDAGELNEAINLYEEIIKSISSNSNPREYARAQNDLGIAYTTLAGNQEKEKNLKRAIQSYQEALRIHTLESYPIDYAAIQNNLGAAYADLALVRDKEENLEKAIKSYQEVLRVYTMEIYPIDYAMTQNNLGNAYAYLAEVRDKEVNLEKAIQSCQEALRIRTLESYPIDYLNSSSENSCVTTPSVGRSPLAIPFITGS